MSSFLDSTGLSRLVSKITDYFAKKDGTYPDMTVGNISNVVPIAKLPTASSVTSNDTTHVPTSQAVYNYALPRGAYARITAPGWVRLAVINYSSAYLAKCGGEIISSQEIDGQDYYIGTFHVFFTLDKNANTITGELLQSYNNNSGSNDGWVFRLKYDTNTHKVYVYGFCGAPLCAMSVMALCPAASEVNLQATLLGGTYDNPPSELAGSVQLDTCRPVKANGSKSVVGSPSNPVYVKSDGSVTECTDIGKEFWIEGTGASAMYKTIGSIEFNANGYFSQLSMEIGPLGTKWTADSQASKILVKLICYGSNYKLDVLAINYSDITSRCLFDTYKADNRVYIVVKIVAYGAGAYAKVVSHGERSWTAGVSYSAGTAPATLDGGTKVTYKYAKINAAP